MNSSTKGIIDDLEWIKTHLREDSMHHYAKVVGQAISMIESFVDRKWEDVPEKTMYELRVVYPDKHKARSLFLSEREARERADHLSVVHKCYVKLNKVRSMATYYIGVGEIK